MKQRLINMVAQAVAWVYMGVLFLLPLARGKFFIALHKLHLVSNELCKREVQRYFSRTTRIMVDHGMGDVALETLNNLTHENDDVILLIRENEEYRKLRINKYKGN